jgi:hypothetical protein
MIEVTDCLSIPDEELRFTASHSSGPGGQNVNKVRTSFIPKPGSPHPLIVNSMALKKPLNPSK